MDEKKDGKEETEGKKGGKKRETGEERERIFNLMWSNWISEFVIRF